MKYLTKRTFSIFWKHSSRYKMSFFFAILCITVADAARAGVPYIYKQIIDGFTAGYDQQTLLVLLFVLAIFSVIHHLGIRAAIYVYHAGITKGMRDIAVTCFEYLHRHSHNFFNNNFVGSLVKRVNRFYRSYEFLYDRFIWDFYPIALNITLAVVILGYQNVWFGVILLVWVAIHISMNYAFSRYKLKYDLERSKYDSKVTGILADTVTNHGNVKFLNGYQREVDNFYTESTKLNKLRRFTWDISNHFEVVQGFFMIATEVALIYLLIIYIGEGKATVGDFVLVQSYVGVIFHKMWGFGRIIRDTYENLADAEEMTEILETPLEIVDSTSAKPIAVDAGEIVFDDVTFRYNKTRTILSNLNLTIPGGQRVALVGHSGAGKSTVTKLLLRMHDVSSGSIKIDGQKIHTVTLESLWGHISYVPQEPILFHRTLMENIRYGRPDATDAEVIEAAKLAHAHEFIETFQDGYETHVGERGVKLSGGERQRVAIARAILKNAPILILDEATSSLDSESEMLIQDALDTLMKGKTVVVIAHRLSTIMKMDRIVVMEDGDVIEDGTHKQLLRKKTGMYRKLWDLQAGEFIG